MMTPEYDFKKIYDEYYQRIVQYLTRIVGPNDAEDIAQDVFDKINSGLGGFQGKSKLSTWIYRIATNTMIDRLRSAAYKHATVNSAIEDAADPKAQGVWGNQKPPATDQVVIRKEMSECVNEFIDNLPPDYKTVIVLSELEGLAIKEIAEILGISVNNVKTRLHRARAKLKAALNEGCDFYHDERNTLACDRKQGQILPKVPK
jgi:RNA polymerase sigma-70 factor (ECF subfamily)